MSSPKSKDGIIKRQEAIIKRQEAIIKRQEAIIKHQAVVIKRQAAEIKTLRNRLEKLERLLGLNSSNSSKPPSSDFFGKGKKELQRKSRKRGARKGHPPYLKKPLPPESVTRTVELEPESCPDCGGVDFTETSEDPLRHQVIDIPPIKPKVTEYLRHVRHCTCCGTQVYAPLPAEAQRGHFGSGVLTMLGILTGALNLSKRKAQMMLNEVFGIPISLGGVSACEKKITEALATPYQEVMDFVQDQDVAHADETSWRRGNKLKGWLWTLCCCHAAFFKVHARRTQTAAKELLGVFAGSLISDRWKSYDFYAGLRQICWAHLKRDFKAISEARGRLGRIGNRLHDLTRHILHLRARVRKGTLSWSDFQQRMPALQKKVESLLQEGAACKGLLAGKCRDILRYRKNLWTFVQDERVDPTNNEAERRVRQGVLWRKMSFGTQSERGANYVERVLTVGATCRLQGKSVIDYFRQICQAHIENKPIPQIFA